MEATLTGRDAHEAIGIYARLAAANARFDAASVAKAVLTATGRRRILRGLKAKISRKPAGRRPRSRSSSPAPAVATSSQAAPARPRRLAPGAADG